jgi:hypothetical protein
MGLLAGNAWWDTISEVRNTLVHSGSLLRTMYLQAGPDKRKPRLQEWGDLKLTDDLLTKKQKQLCTQLRKLFVGFADFASTRPKPV